jgi:ribosomal protein S18 acetylase RimI-like enzyme
MSPLFCGHELAARIERVEAELMGAVARRRGEFAIEIAGGTATFVEPGSPFNKVAGLGFAGLPAEQDLERVEAAFAAAGSPVQVELASLGDAAVAELLTARGYRLAGFENVLGRAPAPQPERVDADGVTVRPATDAEQEAWLEVVIEGVAHPDEDGVAAHEQFSRADVERAERDLLQAGVEPWVALRGGEIAGGGGLRLVDGIAQMAGAATVPAHRRRGIQAALTAARLSAAGDAGCEVAVVTTQPGSTSQRNVQRRGFDLLYTRAVLVRFRPS